MAQYLPAQTRNYPSRMTFRGNELPVLLQLVENIDSEAVEAMALRAGVNYHTAAAVVDAIREHVRPPVEDPTPVYPDVPTEDEAVEPETFDEGPAPYGS